MAEYLARVITGRRDLVIERVLLQKELINEGHSVRLDALAIAKDGPLINYEMQNESMHGMEQRMRMCESSINLSFLAKGGRLWQPSGHPRLRLLGLQDDEVRSHEE